MVYSSLITCPTQQRLPKKMEQEKKIRREIANCNERRRMQSINAGFNSLKAMLPKHDNEKLSKASILQQTAEYLQALEQEKTCYLQELNDIKKLLNPELLELHLKRVQEAESNRIEHQPLKRMKVEVSSLDFSNSESSDEGIQLGNASPKREDQPNGQTTIVNSVPADNKTAVLSGVVKNGCTSTLSNGAAPTLQLGQLALNGGPVQLTVDSDDNDVVRAELVQVRKVLDKERKLRMKLEEQVRDLEAQLYPTRIKEIVQQFQPTGVCILDFAVASKRTLPESSSTKTNEFCSPQMNIYHQPLQMKENENDLAVTSVIIEQQPVAETVEIETQNCGDFIGHLQSANAANLLTNQPVQITSSNASFISKSSNVNTIPSTTATLHIIAHQDLSHNTLLDTTNFVEPSGLRLDEVTNKILTSTAFLTATASPTTTINKPAKPKSSSSTASKEKATSAPVAKQLKASAANSAASGTRDTSIQSVNTSQSNAAKSHPASSKKSGSTASAAASTGIQPSELNNGKPEKSTKKAKASTPSAVEPPALFSPAAGLDLSTNSKLTAGPPTTVTVQLIDSNITSSIDKFEATPAATANSAGRNNNLDAIVEAIRHLEGDMFGSKEKEVISVVTEIADDRRRSNELKHLKQELNDKVRTESRSASDSVNGPDPSKLREEILRKLSRPGVIVSSTNS